MPNYTNSLWTPTVEGPVYPRAQAHTDGGVADAAVAAVDVAVDVAIVGGGITGVTAARLLKDAGLKVALIEARRLGKGETGKTTAHLTQVLDMRFHDLVARVGVERAREVAASQRAAIERIASFVRTLAIDCQLEQVPGYLFAVNEAEAHALDKEESAAASVGVAVTSTNDTRLPFPVARALRFDNQAQFHPRRYLLGLAQGIDGAGSHIFEDTQVQAVEESDDGESCRVLTDQGIVRAREVILATHVPLFNNALMQTKLAAYRTYVVACALEREPPRGLFWDMASPYHYVRSQQVDGVWYLMIGGEDHKVGEADDTHEPFLRLEDYVTSHFGQTVAATDYRWSGQIIEPIDGLPYIGRSPGMNRIYMGTGYAGNGLTAGTLAGMLLTDAVLGKTNPWADLYGPSRWKPLTSAKAFIEENVSYPKHLIADRFKGLDGVDALAELSEGEGKVLKIEGEKVAVYRNSRGDLVTLSPVCSHLGCLVHWNTTEKSWDCPCHGSRFDPHGHVLNGPASASLEPKQLPEKGEPARQEGSRRGSAEVG